MTFEQLRRLLLPETMTLFTAMARAYLASRGDRRFLLVISGAGAHLLFTGTAGGQFDDVDPGALTDLVGYGLLQQEYGSKGSKNFRLSGDGARFYQWLMTEEGTPMEQVEKEVRKMLGGEGYSLAHPSSAHHLSEAFALLWSSDESERSVSEVGEHLRNAIFDVCADVTTRVQSREREKPIASLRGWLCDSGLNEREVRVVSRLIDLVEASLHLDQRLTHARDEADKGRPITEWDELRRAAFVTAYACYEIHLAGTRSATPRSPGPPE